MSTNINSTYITHPRQSGAQVHVVTVTPSSGAADELTPLLLVHGLGSSSSYWLGLLGTRDGQELVKGRTVWAIDAYGHGKSGRRQDDKSIPDLTESLGAITEALLKDSKHQQVILSGHSMSGYTTSLLAATRPDLIEKLVLHSPTVRLPDAGKQGLAKRGQDALASLSSQSQVALTVARTGVSPNSLEKNPLASAFIRHLILNTDQESYAVACNALATSTDDMFKPQDIKCPVHFVHGEKDYMVKEDVLRGWAKEMGGKTEAGVTVLPGIGHWGAVESPEEVAKAFKQAIVG